MRIEGKFRKSVVFLGLENERGFFAARHSVSGPRDLRRYGQRGPDNCGTMYHIESPIFIPLAILIGHHVIERQEDDIIVPKFQLPPHERQPDDTEPRKNEERRTGFAVVLPIQRVFGLFESEEMQKIIKGNVQHVRKESGLQSDWPADVKSAPSS